MATNLLVKCRKCQDADLVHALRRRPFVFGFCLNSQFVRFNGGHRVEVGDSIQAIPLWGARSAQQARWRAEHGKKRKRKKKLPGEGASGR